MTDITTPPTRIEPVRSLPANALTTALHEQFCAAGEGDFAGTLLSSVHAGVGGCAARRAEGPAPAP